MLVVRRSLPRVTTIPLVESFQIAQFSDRRTDGTGTGKKPFYSKVNKNHNQNHNQNRNYNKNRNPDSRGGSSAPNPVVQRRTMEAKGAMKSFFDSAGSSNTEHSGMSSPTGNSIWQRLKRDANSRTGVESVRGDDRRPGLSRPRRSTGDSRPSRNSEYHGRSSGHGNMASHGDGGRHSYRGRASGPIRYSGAPGVPRRAPGTGGFRGRRGSGGDERGGRSERERTYDVGDIEHSLLNDYEYFDDLFARGGYVQSRSMDPVDKLLGEVFEESFKTRDGTVLTKMELTPESERRALAVDMKPRPMSELLTHSIMPDITTASPGSFAHQTASYAWEAISKNPYYSEQQRHWMCNRIAKLTDRAFKFEATDYLVDDMVLDPNFRYGIENMPDEEQEHLAKVDMLRELETTDKGITKLMRRTRHDDVLEESLEYFITPDVAQYFTVDQMTFAEEQAEVQRKLKEEQMRLGNVQTDWSMEAVVNEDDL